ncbi:decaprenyl-phosphate phosphoribosyltransferase [Legionella israelensis]|uniref:Decaprenyl-phosphate phosphoribosyltransferase n=1 Tax=Legionella israelensis TaxID=454 RepID=A0A0W0WMU6_9GAMM|nr:decaprenyl-phosphate phosphoribosyltransferase [Legionella israelensis]KTD33625.1 phosphoribose diphosphate:decaprenyl-phosphate phosphoribosyltransferase [Legionella israelensis]QBR84487.1 decaprenyl-phosphate phosphoribosyltransferase [Legionella israelensis]QBS08793.1 decaprenyl-phosphate phosphoribosyltransferase [Legionella israelensis]SCY12477.1 4-hydroxybenzoate polyprenyltransferase [Legionella israelensis DSM 19235]STX58471.1 4-hydroxybenzoate octaprenyltransferase [Legionella isra
MTRLKDFYLLLRPSHWSKSGFVLLGVFYAEAFNYLGVALLAALSFCLTASSVYIYNDIQDRKEDILHPQKRNRPLARGSISISGATYLLSGLLISAFVLAWNISVMLLLILSFYLLVNLAYNHFLKLIPIMDVSCIALGFMLRVLAGTIGIGLPISWWLTITVTLLSFFIALSKRRLELQLGLKHSARKVLKKYNKKVLKTLMILSGLGSFISYLLYTIYAKNESFYFMLTLPFAAFALWRFIWLTSLSHKNDDPVNVFLSDGLSFLNLLCFVLLTYMALRQ